MQLFTQFFAIAAAAAPLFSYADAFALRSTNDIIPGKWIIQLKPEIDTASIATHHNKVRKIRARNLGRRNGDGIVGGGMDRSFHFGNFKAYAGSFDDRTIEELKAMPEVLVVEQDYIMTTSALVTRKISENCLESMY
jgi:oryzin